MSSHAGDPLSAAPLFPVACRAGVMGDITVASAVTQLFTEGNILKQSQI